MVGAFTPLTFHVRVLITMIETISPFLAFEDSHPLACPPPPRLPTGSSKASIVYDSSSRQSLLFPQTSKCPSSTFKRKKLKPQNNYSCDNGSPVQSTSVVCIEHWRRFVPLLLPWLKCSNCLEGRISITALRFLEFALGVGIVESVHRQSLGV